MAIDVDEDGSVEQDDSRSHGTENKIVKERPSELMIQMGQNLPKPDLLTTHNEDSRRRIFPDFGILRYDFKGILAPAALRAWCSFQQGGHYSYYV